MPLVTTVTPSGPIIPGVGVPSMCPQHPLSLFQLLHMHATHPLLPTQPPPGLCAHLHTLPCTSMHLCAPLCTIYPGFSYTHFTFCAPAHLLHCPMACGQGNSFFWARFQLVIPRGLQGLSPKGGIGVLTPTYIHTTHTSVVK